MSDHDPDDLGTVPVVILNDEVRVSEAPSRVMQTGQIVINPADAPARIIGPYAKRVQLRLLGTGDVLIGGNSGMTQGTGFLVRANASCGLDTQAEVWAVLPAGAAAPVTLHWASLDVG